MNKLNILYDFGAIDDSVIVEFEKKIGIRFPLVYKKLMKLNNGLQFLENSFEFNDSDGKKYGSSFSFCAFGEVLGSDAIEDYQDYDIYGYENIVTFGLNGGCDYIAFDYRQNPTTDNPSVVIMYHDEYIKDENGNAKMRVIQIADNFDDFLNLLHE